jgi:hypothetical protein
MTLSPLVFFIGIVSIIRFLRGSIIPLSHIFLRSLVTLIKQKVPRICIFLAILLMDGALVYQLLFKLFHLRQEPGQSINDFLARIQFLWNQVDLFDPIWKDTTDVEMYVTCSDQHRLHRL